MAGSPPTTDPGQAGAGTDANLSRACCLLSIDLGAIAENYQTLRRQCHAQAVAAVVKADGYGLGAAAVAPVLARAGARSFFVAQLEEAIALRPVLDAVIPACSILVLNGLMPGAEDDYRAHNIAPVLNSLEEIERWRAYNRAQSLTLPAAVHVDTGMRRLGLSPADLARIAAAPDLLEGLVVTLVMSHLACADEPEHRKNGEQLAAFKAALSHLPKVTASLANSAGMLLDPAYHFNLARPGVALYGVNPTPGRPKELKQVVRLQGKILQLGEIDAGETVGYGATYRAATRRTIATVGAGYADGFLRHLSNRAHAFIEGRQVPLVGRVSMDLITLDVTDLPAAAVRPGSWVDLIGSGDGVERLAEEAGTIGYEILTSLGRRYHRHYLGPDQVAPTRAGA